MTRFYLLLFVFNSLIIAKGNSEETINNDNDEGESDSIQVVQRDTVINIPILTDNHDKLQENDAVSDLQRETLKNIDTAEVITKYDKLLDQIDSDSTDTVLEIPEDNITELSLPADTSAEIKNAGNINNKEGINQAHAHDEKGQVNSFNNQNDDWRSAEKVDDSEEKSSNEETEPHADTSIEDDFSTEEYLEKKVSGSFQLPEQRQPERRSNFGGKFTHAHTYATHDDHESTLEPSPMRRFGEVSAPQYRPVLTRNGIVFSPSIYPLQPGRSLLERLAGRSLFPHIPPHVNMGHERFHKQRKTTPKVISEPQYEDTKMMDDYNDYGPNTNTYSYTPVRTITTQAPPHQNDASNKFNVFQKLIEASNHPKPLRRSFNDFSSAQRQYPETYDPYRRRLL